jgi:hypothetical protein
LAFLRFSRDKRGYEHFSLVEATTNRRGKTRTRILYWFRTPPDVKVGREPFDAEVRRALEAQNPNVQFDWRKIVETPIPSADAEKWRERRRLERAERAARRGEKDQMPGVAEPAEPLEADTRTEDITDGADISVDAAEQQADALEPTEESLVSAAASIDAESHAPSDSGGPFPPIEAGAQPAGARDEDRGRGPRRRRRRRRGGRGGREGV